MKTWQKILLVTLAFIGAIAFGLKIQSSRAKNSLEKYKAELRAKGEKLTFEELGPSHATNGIENTLRILDCAAKLPAGGRSVYNMDVMSFESPGSANIAWKMSKPPLGDWNTNSVLWSELEMQVDSSRGHILTIREALKLSDLDLGWNQKDPFNRPTNNFVGKRNLAKWLAGAAITELHRKRNEEALEDLLTLIDLTQLHKEELTLVNQMIRNAIGGLGLATSWQLLQMNDWTDMQLKALQSKLSEVAFLEMAEKGILGERALFISYLDKLEGTRKLIRDDVAQGLSWRERVQADFIFWGIWRPSEDEKFGLEILQSNLGAVRDVQTKGWTEIRKYLDKKQAQIDRTGSLIGKLRYFFSLMAIPNMSRAINTAVKNETMRQMALTDIALKRYNLLYRSLPEDLQTLAPEFLPSVPRDPMDGQPLRYRPNSDGTFLLYSVGLDGKDDGGDPNPPVSTNKFDLWSGRDAVWPKAAQPTEP